MAPDRYGEMQSGDMNPCSHHTYFSVKKTSKRCLLSIPACRPVDSCFLFLNLLPSHKIDLLYHEAVIFTLFLTPPKHCYVYDRQVASLKYHKPTMNNCAASSAANWMRMTAASSRTSRLWVCCKRHHENRIFHDVVSCLPLAKLHFSQGCKACNKKGIL